MLLKTSSLVLLALCVFASARSQDLPGSFSQQPSVPGTVSPKFVDGLSEQVQGVSRFLQKRSQKSIAAFQRQEQKLRRQLERKDSALARELFSGANDFYQRLSSGQEVTSSVMMPLLDSFQVSLSFLQNNPSFLTGKVPVQRLASSVGEIRELKVLLGQSVRVKELLASRSAMLQGRLSGLGLLRQLKGLQKKSLEYADQLREVTGLLKSPKRLVAKGLAVLAQSAPFKSFFFKHSELARFMPTVEPGGVASIPMQPGFAALQTRAEVSEMIQQHTGVSPQQLTSLLQQGREQAGGASAGSVAGVDPGSITVKPSVPVINTQKSKKFWQRLEVRTDFQSTRSGTFFPARLDLGARAGYKLNDNSLIGLGASYKLGLGKGWQKIRVSHQGIGLRSFIDWRMKGSLWLSGGFEMNYLPLVGQLAESSSPGVSGKGLNWQQSGLIGLSKVLPVQSKFLKKTSFQLLWDFLSYSNRPVSQPLLFRAGYSF